MIIAIDSGSREYTLAVALDAAGQVLKESFLSDVLGLAPWLQTAQEEGLMEALVVASGPGSYTGVRTGLALVQGVRAVLPLPLFTSSSLRIAWETGRDAAPSIATRKAGRSRWFAAPVDAGGVVGPCILVEESDLRSSSARLVGEHESTWRDRHVAGLAGVAAACVAHHEPVSGSPEVDYGPTLVQPLATIGDVFSLSGLRP